MPFGRSKSDSEKNTPGLKEELSSFTRGVKSYLAARGELLSIEGKEAAKIIGRKAGLGGLAAFFLVLGYLLFVVGLVGFTGQLLLPDSPINLRSWVGGALVVSGLHFLIGILLFVAQKRTGRGGVIFEISRTELRKDQEWLSNEKEN